ncbi:peptidase S8, partial [Burkholderia cenocepacia]|nr:peptidase S8 [Burkholderia cenocepacia]
MFSVPRKPGRATRFTRPRRARPRPRRLCRSFQTRVHAATHQRNRLRHPLFFSRNALKKPSRTPLPSAWRVAATRCNRQTKTQGPAQPDRRHRRHDGYLRGSSFNMRAKRFNFALARPAHARMLAGMLSAAALLPLAGCGGGGGDGSNPSSS